MSRKFWIGAIGAIIGVGTVFIAMRYWNDEDFLAPPADQYQYPEEPKQDQPFPTPEAPTNFDKK